jgi:hypothetical protein
MFENSMMDEHQEALHATNNGTFGTPSQEFIKWLESLAVKTTIINEEEN